MIFFFFSFYEVDHQNTLFICQLLELIAIPSVNKFDNYGCLPPLNET